MDYGGSEMDWELKKRTNQWRCLGRSAAAARASGLWRATSGSLAGRGAAAAAFRAHAVWTTIVHTMPTRKPPALDADVEATKRLV